MAGIQVIDGQGSGTLVGVTEDNHIKTAGRTRSERDAEALAGQSYNINTGIITLTSANESAVLYYKNTDTVDHVIPAIALYAGNSTGGSYGQGLWQVERNPTGGTIVSNATAVAMNANNDYGSSTILTASVYKGAEGYTLTGGTDHILFGQTSAGRLFASLTYLRLAPGSSVGILYTPPASNSSQPVYAALAPVFRLTLGR